MPKGRIGELWSYNAHLESERSLLRICASQRLPGTCDWLFGHSNYRAWLSPNGPACLWIHGIAGAGKTILSSSVLKELDKNDTRDTVVLSYFFDGVAGHGHSMQDLVAMIACKFAKYQRQPAPEPILSCLRDGLYQSRSTMSPASLKLSFRRLLAGVDPQIQVILLVDGLDSYEWIKGMVIDEITLANLDRDRLRHFKCCISSRTPLNAELYSDQVININMNEEPGLYQDIYRYAEVKTAALTCLSTEQNLTQADLTEQLCSYANGMFLWVALVIHRSPHLESLSGVLQAVHSVPSHIESMYQQALQSIPSNTFEQLLSIELSNPHGSLGLGGKATSASVNQTALRISSGYGFTALVKLYLEMGVGPDGAPCASCETPLQLAAACGRTEIVALLLNSGASVGSQGPPHGETPLYLAAASGFAHTVTLLLEHGADPEATSAGSSWTPLHVAAAHGHLEVMHSFLNSNIDINSVTTATNETPLHLAAHQGHFHVVKYLLNSHRVSLTEREFYESIVQKSYFRTWSEEVLLDLRNDRGFVWEVNARCSAEEDLGKLRSLAKGYADVNIPTSDGRTALHYAASNGHEAVVRLLLERGADPEGGGLSHHTALRAAAENGHLPIVRLLLIHTSNMAVRCKDWRTILEHSAETGHQAIADLLLWQAFGLEIAGQGFRSAMLNVVGKSKQNIVQGILQRTRPDHSL
ncbi:hypothetical protein MMC30_002632 [Trapelia coarctata]|nr:hypothetical protein [Trapelia coarctata]